MRVPNTPARGAPIEAVDIGHVVFADFDFPSIHLSCSCAEWRKSVPVVAGSGGMERAAEEHRTDVFRAPIGADA